MHTDALTRPHTLPESAVGQGPQLSVPPQPSGTSPQASLGQLAGEQH
jgi:hypothetical protein